MPVSSSRFLSPNDWSGPITSYRAASPPNRFLAVGDCAGALTIFRLVPLEEEEGARRNDEQRAPVRAEIVLRYTTLHAPSLLLFLSLSALSL
eukprot:COSAG05_NODE_21225_length_273_cov_0.896552_1_plen_91_part_11